MCSSDLFSLVKPYIKVIGFTMLLPIAFAAINRSILTGVSFAMCFIAMTTGYTFSVTEKNSMERLYGILPIKKSEMVIGRYLFVLALGAMALVVSLITQPIVLRVWCSMRKSVSMTVLICSTHLYLPAAVIWTICNAAKKQRNGLVSNEQEKA